MNAINNKLAYRTVQDIRATAIRKMQNLPLSYLDVHSSGDIVQRVIADVDQLSMDSYWDFSGSFLELS